MNSDERPSRGTRPQARASSADELARARKARQRERERSIGAVPVSIAVVGDVLDQLTGLVPEHARGSRRAVVEAALEAAVCVAAAGLPLTPAIGEHIDALRRQAAQAEAATAAAHAETERTRQVLLRLVEEFERLGGAAAEARAQIAPEGGLRPPMTS